MWARIERILTILMTVAALAVAGLAVRREFAPSPADSGLDAARPPRLIPGWQRIAASGIQLGDPNGAVQIIQFGDLECPFCRRFQDSVIAPVRAQFRSTVSVEFVHLPLPMHRFAGIAARAMECAAAQGHAKDFLNVVYRKQDSLGFKSWASYGADAGVRDTLALAKCAVAGAPAARIDSGKAIAQRLGIHATPTIMIDGWLLQTVPAESTVARMIRGLTAGTPASKIPGLGAH